MKKIFTLLSLSVISILANAQTPVDFETNSPGWGGFEATIDPSFANPSKMGINTSNTVMKMLVEAGKPNYGLAYSTGYSSYVVTTANCVVKLMVNKPIASNVTFSLKPNDNTPSLELSIPNTQINQWQELTFDFTAFIGKTVIELAIFPDNTNNRPADVMGYVDNISFNDQSTLPLQLISFSGSFIGLQNTLSWKTAAELNFNRFEIEKSDNGKLFTKIGEVKGGKSEYSFVDKNISFSDDLYYRLKMVDNDGTYISSKVIAINSKSKNESSFSFYPNPATDYLNIDFSSEKSFVATLSVYDLSGKTLTKISQNVNKGNNSLKVNTTGLNAGTYFMRVSDKNSSLKTQKFIVSR